MRDFGACLVGIMRVDQHDYAVFERNYAGFAETGLLMTI
jgi:hypothetical protein